MLGYEHPSGEIHIQLDDFDSSVDCGSHLPRIYRTPVTEILVLVRVRSLPLMRNKLNSSTGQDTGNALCSVGEVEDLFEGVLSDHDGPYDGVRIGAAC